MKSESRHLRHSRKSVVHILILYLTQSFTEKFIRNQLKDSQKQITCKDIFIPLGTDDVHVFKSLNNLTHINNLSEIYSSFSIQRALAF